MRIVVVGAGAWGTAFAHLLARHDHDVTLAARDADLARAIDATGENPRYHPGVALGVAGATIEEAPLAEADLVCVAVPSRVFGDVVAALPGSAPVLSLSKGLDPGQVAACRRS